MSAAKANILGRLRHALADPDLPFPPENPAPPVYEDRLRITALAADGEDAPHRFKKELEALHGTCDLAASAIAARIHAVNQVLAWETEIVDARADAREAKRLLVWPGLDDVIPGLADNLESRGFQLHVPTEFAQAEVRADLQRIQIGITAVDAAFATTGSVLLRSGPERSRIASLLPLHHLALVPVARLWVNAEAWLEHERRQGALEQAMRRSANLTLVSGPSKSADIESRLTWGVHGPRHVHAVVIPA